MVEIHLKLGFDAVLAMMKGEELATVVDEEDLTIVLKASELAQKQFKDEVQKALLHLLPTPGGKQ